MGRVLAQKGHGLILWGRVSEQEGCGHFSFFFPFFSAFLGGFSILTFSVSDHLGFFGLTILITLSVCGWEVGRKGRGLTISRRVLDWEGCGLTSF